MKHLMCRNQRPDPRIWQTLFELARAELGFPPDRLVADPADLIAVDSFYKFNAGGIGYGRRFFYLRVLHAGSDRIQHSLEEFSRSVGDGRIRKYGIQYHDADVEDVASISGLLHSPAFRGGALDALCAVTAVRDPIERFLAAYAEMEHRQQVASVLRDALPAYARHGGDDAVARFERFATDFIRGPATSGIFRGYDKTGDHAVARLFSMTGVLWGLARLRDCRGGGTTTTGPALAAYLPSLADLDAAFPRLVNATCPGPPRVGAALRERAGGARDHADRPDPSGFRVAAERAWREGGNVSRALCAVHCLDYACFDEIPVPALCREVYSKPSFIHKVLSVAASGRQPTMSSSCGQGNFP